jgi:hypothetical protein
MGNPRHDAPPPKPAILSAKSTPDERKSANDLHHQSLVEHALDVAEYNGHDHFVGSQGKRSHEMPANDAHKQSGQFIRAPFVRPW